MVKVKMFESQTADGRLWTCQPWMRMGGGGGISAKRRVFAKDPVPEEA